MGSLICLKIPHFLIFQFHKFVCERSCRSMILINTYVFFIVISCFCPVECSVYSSIQINYTEFFVHDILVIRLNCNPVYGEIIIKRKFSIMVSFTVIKSDFNNQTLLFFLK